MTNTCLLIIDLLHDFLDPWEQGARADLIASTNGLVACFRKAGLPIIWVRQAFKPDLSDAFLEMRKQNVHMTIEGTRGAEIHSDLDCQPQDAVITKKRYSAFFRTDLEDRLAEADITELVICGINTHACIRMAVIDAYQRDYRVILPRECIGSYSEEHSRISLEYMDGKLAQVLPVDEVRRRLANPTAMVPIDTRHT